MSKRVCSKPGCPTLSNKAGLCAVHQAEAEKKRGTPGQRGYDWQHRIDAAKAKQRAIQNRTLCPICEQPMTAGQKLDYGHSIDRAIDPTARADRVEHSTCNRAQGARLGNDRV